MSICDVKLRAAESSAVEGKSATARNTTDCKRGATNPAGFITTGGWYDIQDLSTMWQDLSGTIPAAVGQRVRRIDNKYTGDNASDALDDNFSGFPICTLQQDSQGRYYLEKGCFGCTLPTALTPVETNYGVIMNAMLDPEEAAATINVFQLSLNTLPGQTFMGYMSATEQPYVDVYADNSPAYDDSAQGQTTPYTYGFYREYTSPTVWTGHYSRDAEELVTYGTGFRVLGLRTGSPTCYFGGNWSTYNTGPYPDRIYGILFGDIQPNDYRAAEEMMMTYMIPFDQLTYEQQIARRAGLKLWWKLDEAVGLAIADSSGAANPGTATGDVTYDHYSLLVDRTGSCIKGADLTRNPVLADNANNIATSDHNRTVEIIVRLDPDGNDSPMLLNLGSPTLANSRFGVFYVKSTNETYFWGLNAGKNISTFDHILDDGAPHIITLTLDGVDQTDIAMYIDGVKYTDNSASPAVATDGAEITVGSMSNNALSGPCFYQHFSICDRAITEEDILLSHATALGEFPSATSGWQAGVTPDFTGIDGQTFPDFNIQDDYGRNWSAATVQTYRATAVNGFPGLQPLSGGDNQTSSLYPGASIFGPDADTHAQYSFVLVTTSLGGTSSLYRIIEIGSFTNSLAVDPDSGNMNIQTLGGSDAFVTPQIVSGTHIIFVRVQTNGKAQVWIDNVKVSEFDVTGVASLSNYNYIRGNQTRMAFGLHRHYPKYMSDAQKDELYNELHALYDLPAYRDSKWDLSTINTTPTATVDTNTLTSETFNNAGGITYNADGTKLIMVGSDNSPYSTKVYEFDLPTPFSIVGMTLSATTPFDLSGQYPSNDPLKSVLGASFSLNGLHMYIGRFSSSDINHYTMTEPFDISTMTHVQTVAGPSDQSNLFVVQGGKKAIVVRSGRYYDMYDLSVPYDISTMVIESPANTFDTTDNRVLWGAVHPNDNQLVTANLDDDILLYDMDGNYDLSSMLLDANPILSPSNTVQACAMRQDGGFLLLQSASTIYEYTL